MDVYSVYHQQPALITLTNIARDNFTPCTESLTDNQNVQWSAVPAVKEWRVSDSA